jgi:hypothetical protein
LIFKGEKMSASIFYTLIIFMAFLPQSLLADIQTETLNELDKPKLECNKNQFVTYSQAFYLQTGKSCKFRIRLTSTEKRDTRFVIRGFEKSVDIVKVWINGTFYENVSFNQQNNASISLTHILGEINDDWVEVQVNYSHRSNNPVHNDKTIQIEVIQPLIEPETNKRN